MKKPVENSATIPPDLHREDFSSDEEYREYLDIEAADYPPGALSDRDKKETEVIARRTIERISGERVRINIRLPSRDVQRIKALALEQGVPYQTLIASVLHQYADREAGMARL